MLWYPCWDMLCKQLNSLLELEPAICMKRHQPRYDICLSMYVLFSREMESVVSKLYNLDSYIQPQQSNSRKRT